MSRTIYSELEYQGQKDRASAASRGWYETAAALSRERRFTEAQRREIERLTQAVTDAQDNADEAASTIARQARTIADLTNDLYYTSERLNAEESTRQSREVVLDLLAERIEHLEATLTNLGEIYRETYEVFFPGGDINHSFAYSEATHVLEGGRPHDGILNSYRNAQNRAAGPQDRRPSDGDTVGGGAEDAPSAGVLRPAC